jgi:hypothetical protein
MLKAVTLEQVQTTLEQVQKMRLQMLILKR